MFKLAVAGALFALCIGLWSFTLPNLSLEANTTSDKWLLAWAIGGLIPFVLGLVVIWLGWRQDALETKQRMEDRKLQTEKLRKEIRELDYVKETRDDPTGINSS